MYSQLADHLADYLSDSASKLMRISTILTISLLLGTPIIIALWLQNVSSTPKELRNLRREGISSSNMKDQTDAKYDLPEGATTDGPIRIKAIFVHPIKSCAPVELNRAQLLKSGFCWDRCFALAIEVTRPEAEGGSIWRFISQRTKPLMSQIKTELWFRHKDSNARDPLVRTSKSHSLALYTGNPYQQPINVNNLASIHAVSALLPAENQPLNALRFRANIWITGAPAFDEETWKRYRVVPKREATVKTVSPTLSVVCRTSRCTMPNVDPLTGRFSTNIPDGDKKRGRAQPSTTLVKYRTVEGGNPKALGYIGMHCVPEDSSLDEAAEKTEGLYVQVGDGIEILERGIHWYGSTGNDY
ncbi:hypothetical protein Forpi1262_v011227 [Fusarium oxysporum f. sp. raphani]|uniref:MOSC domain-containing protein n=1 Tax=Fusarium oxysporum f. sp. raphani TaxID=96318 RepID=A0A8J5U2W1_FUSOX|nr:hypothetical protein Forpi1262_v011227 [Fusarium oxysporum f. sp. raphani]